MTALQQFTGYLRKEKNYSEHTVLAYTKDLEQFRVFLCLEFAQEDLLVANFEMIRSWVATLSEQELDARSIARKVSTLRSFYKFCMRKDLVQLNPAISITTPKLKKRAPSFVSEKGMDLLFENVEFPADYEGRRDRMVLSTFYFTGMRLSELIGIRIADVDTGLKTIKVLGKRNKERLIPVSGLFLEEYRQYLVARNAHPVPGEPWLFLSAKGKKLTRAAVYKMVRHYLGMVTTIDKRSPHVLRHTFATHLLNNGADINAIKEILGHANLAATQVYTHNSLEKLKKIYHKAHPRGKD